jgi:hypothetical protein
MARRVELLQADEAAFEGSALGVPAGFQFNASVMGGLQWFAKLDEAGRSATCS